MSLADFVLSAAGKLKDDYIRLNSHFASIKTNLLAGDQALQAQIDALTPGAVPAYYKTNVLNYAAPGATIYDGVTSAVSAINAALAAMPTGGTLYFPMLGNGEYLIDVDLTLVAYPDISIEWESGAKISVADGKTLTFANTKIIAGLWHIFNLNTNGLIAGTCNVKEIYFEWFGAVGDNSTDDYASISHCIDFLALSTVNVLKITNKIFKHSQTIMMTNLSNKHIYSSGTLNYTGNDSAFVLSGGSRNIFYNLRITRDYTISLVSASSILLYNGLILLDTKYNAFYNTYVAGFAKGLYINAVSGSGSYNNFYESELYNNLINYSTDYSGTGFTNECHTFGGRFSISAGFSDYIGSIYCKIAPDSNNHIFYGVTLESAIVERKILCDGNYCMWSGCRLESQNASGVDIEINGNFNKLIGCYEAQETGGTRYLEGVSATYNCYFNDRKLDLDVALTRRVTKVVAVSGGSYYSYVTTSGDTYLLVDTSQHATTRITLSFDVKHSGREIIIKKTDPTSNLIRIYSTTQSYFDNTSSAYAVLRNQNDSVTFLNDGSKIVLKDRILPLAESYVSNPTIPLNYGQGVITRESMYYTVDQARNLFNVYTESGTSSANQLTGVTADTTATSATITANYSSPNYELEVGNFIAIAGVTGKKMILSIVEVLADTTYTIVLDSVCDATVTGGALTFYRPIIKKAGQVYTYENTYPSTGTHAKGDIVYNSNVSAGEYIGWVCITSGTPGIWKGFGLIAT